MLWIAIDLLLLLGLTLRLTRFVVADDLGGWWIRHPAEAWARRRDDNGVAEDLEDTGKRGRLVSGLFCPFCVGFWLGVLALVSLALAGGPGDTAEWWRWVAGALSLNWVSAHLGARAGDTNEEDQ